MDGFKDPFNGTTQRGQKRVETLWDWWHVLEKHVTSCEGHFHLASTISCKDPATSPCQHTPPCPGQAGCLAPHHKASQTPHPRPHLRWANRAMAWGSPTHLTGHLLIRHFSKTDGESIFLMWKQLSLCIFSSRSLYLLENQHWKIKPV